MHSFKDKEEITEYKIRNIPVNRVIFRDKYGHDGMGNQLSALDAGMTPKDPNQNSQYFLFNLLVYLQTHRS